MACDSTVTGLSREETIEAFSFGSSLLTPVDLRTGLPTGGRQHRPIRFTKAVDRCTPLLIKALTADELVSGFIRFYRPAPVTGEEEQFFTIEITGGRVVSHSIVSPDTKNPETESSPVLEQVGMTFQTITWTFESSGGSHTDTLERPAARYSRGPFGHTPRTAAHPRRARDGC